jgi:hypothetical protein
VLVFKLIGYMAISAYIARATAGKALPQAIKAKNAIAVQLQKVEPL